MTDLRTETVPLDDGSELRLTVAEPDGSARGGIVVLHESRGVTDGVRWLVHSLAMEGFQVVAPHLYHRDGADELGAEDTDEQVRDQVNRLTGASVMADTDTAFGWLAERGVTADRMGVIGFDLGGSVALVVATQRSLGAAVTVAGNRVTEPLSDDLPAPLAAVPELTCPWLGLFGERSQDPTVHEVEKLRAAASSAEVASDVVVYPEVDHRFDFDQRATADAWQRTLNWFDSHLR
ncbi:dienelactone hydrolase family protein [Pseudonocardia acaciae]|uniref:dienelactone hydrolase family protein n=1 Tax=Pseudonocardia acaciae TaxID=551276 RepID=UPI0004909A51|nr:dienelactone hydrolase family protein [Pseudonocardia acaciae]